METYQMIAKTLPGLEQVLAQELTELGANDVEIGRRMVAFSGDKEMMYRANFCHISCRNTRRGVRDGTECQVGRVP